MNELEENLITENESLEKKIISPDEIKKIKDDLREERKNAENTLSVLKVLVANGKIHETIFEKLVSNIEKDHEEIRQSKSLNTKLYNELTLQKDKVSSMLKETGSWIIDVKNIKDNIKKLEKKVENDSGNIDNLKSEANESKKAITKVKGDVKNQLKTANQTNKSIDKILGDLKDKKIIARNIVKYLLDVNKETKTSKKEISELLVQSRKKLENIKDYESKINSLHRSAKSNKNEIFNWYEKILKPKGLKDELKVIETTIKNHQDRIEEQLLNSTSNRLTYGLKEKLTKTEKTLKFRRGGTILITIFLLIGSIVYVVINEGFGDNRWEYIELMYPLIFLLVFFVLQYTRMNKFYEEYYFKYISAFGLPAYFELLEGRDEDKATNYMIETIKSIHMNPSEDINKNSKDNIFDYIVDGIKSLFGSNKLNVNKIIKDLTKEQVGEIFEFIQNQIKK